MPYKKKACPDCLMKESTRQIKRRAKLFSLGICLRCTNPLDEKSLNSGSPTCSDCKAS